MDTTETKDWEVTAERFVGFIDIMGFKDMVLRSTHDEIYEMMKKIDSHKRFSAEFKWVDGNDEFVRTTTYSDSIIVYSKDNSLESFLSFVCTLSSLSDQLFTDEIPHKGAFAYGTMTLDTEKSIFFGQPLIDAYLLQDELIIYSIVGHHSAERKIDTLISESKYEDQVFFFTNYLCPFKNGTANHLAVFPINTLKPDLKYISMHQKLYASIKSLRYKTSGALRKYIDSTEKFWLDVRVKYEL